MVRSKYCIPLRLYNGMNSNDENEINFDSDSSKNLLKELPFTDSVYEEKLFLQ